MQKAAKIHEQEAAVNCDAQHEKKLKATLQRKIELMPQEVVDVVYLQTEKVRRELDRIRSMDISGKESQDIVEDIAKKLDKL